MAEALRCPNNSENWKQGICNNLVSELEDYQPIPITRRLEAAAT